MIYNIAEGLATISESVIIFFFLIYTLSFKDISDAKKCTITAAAFVVYNILVFMLNWFYTLEGPLTVLYLFVLTLYCHLTLRRKIWFQCIIVLLVFMCIYIINLTVSIAVSNILDISVERVILMRNPMRIFLLLFTKILLTVLLYILGNLMTKRKMIFSTAQCVAIFLVFLISFIIGVIFQRNQLDNDFSDSDSIAITTCLILINCLLLVVVYLIASKNNERIKNRLLNLQIESEKKNMEESVIWNRKVERIQHDMKNHLNCILDLVRNNHNERAVRYIERLSSEANGNIPKYICTNHPALNAILNLKRSQCSEKKIDFKCCIPSDLPDFDDVDLCIILSNLYDNAIEAECREEYPVINLNISTVGNYLSIKMKNRISESVLRDNKALETTKKDKEHHGLGLLSVGETVQKNDGMQEFYEEENWFVANILIKINVFD